ncbi:MAG TPA: cupin domain-containing protein [Blastocatellia bacterium]|nr:cupin domain-containing protein [Blastocatellia bacterium]
MSTVSPSEESSHIQSSLIEWQSSPIDGVSYKRLRSCSESGEQTALIRFAPGTKFPAHNHPAGEQVYVIEGELQVGKYHLVAGDYLYTPPDGKHAASTKDGCLFLVTVPKAIEIL